MIENSISSPQDFLVSFLCGICDKSSLLSFMLVCVMSSLVMRFTLFFIMWIAKHILVIQSSLLGEKNFLQPTQIDIKEPLTIDRNLVIWLSFISTILEGIILWACIIKLSVFKMQNSEIIQAIALQSNEGLKDLLNNENYLYLICLINMCKLIPYQVIQIGSVLFYVSDYFANRRSFEIAYAIQISNFFYAQFGYLVFIGTTLISNGSGILFALIAILGIFLLSRVNDKAFQNHGRKKQYYRQMIGIFYFVPIVSALPFLNRSCLTWMDGVILVCFGIDLAMRLLVARYFKYIKDNN